MTTEQTNMATELPSGPIAASSGLWGRVTSLLSPSDNSPGSNRDNRDVFKWVKRALSDASTDKHLPHDLRRQTIDALRNIKDGELDGDKLPAGDKTRDQVQRVVDTLYDLGLHHATNQDASSVKYVRKIRRDLTQHTGIKPSQVEKRDIYHRYPTWAP